MRWKLLVATSLVAAVVSAGASYGLVYALYHFRRPYPTTLTVLAFVELIHLVTSVSASMFVYRHTARRRKLQALLTVLSSLLLGHALLRLAASLLPIFVKSLD